VATLRQSRPKTFGMALLLPLFSGDTAAPSATPPPVNAVTPHQVRTDVTVYNRRFITASMRCTRLWIGSRTV
jgi:hypothetical protein